MVSADKAFTFGSSAVLSAFLYISLKDMAPMVTTRALQWTAGGVAASTLFQAYYPNYHTQMRETFGDNFTKAVTWLYPGVILLAGYVGGLPRDINLFAGSMFFGSQHFISSITSRMVNDQLSSASELLCRDVEKAVKDGLLKDAAKKLDEVEDLLKQRTASGNESHRDYTSDRCKSDLSQAFLELSTPKIADAEKWALAIHSNRTKLKALKRIIDHLLKTNGDETKVLELLGTCKTLIDSDSTSLLVLMFEIAVQYEKSSLLNKVKKLIPKVGGHEQDITRLLTLLNKAIEKDDFEIAKLALKKASELIEHAEVSDMDFWVWYNFRPSEGVFNSQIPVHGQSPESDILYNLVVNAARLEEWSEAKQFLKHKKLTYQRRVAAQLDLAHRLGQDDQIEEMRMQLKEASDFITTFTYPKDMEDRVVNAIAFRQKWFAALLSVQLKFDLDGAFDTIEKLPQHHEESYLVLARKAFDGNKELAKRALAKVTPLFKELSPLEQQEYAKIQATLAPETLFVVCGDAAKLSEVVKEKSACTRVLLTLAEARLKRQEYDQADALFELITQDEPWVRLKVEQLKSWPRIPARRFGFI
ncbi:hypothetical protein [Simkania sp.]|uniref:hypothetical protein n=1 Tax=Simkania sp. TaxID=34094 RepID=UPI003B51DEBF